MKKLLLLALLSVFSVTSFAYLGRSFQVAKPEITFKLPQNMKINMPDKDGPKGLKVYSYQDSKIKPNRSVSVMVFKLAPNQKGANMDMATHNFAAGIVNAFGKQHRQPALQKKADAMVRPVLVKTTKYQMARINLPHLYTNVYSTAGKEYIYAFILSASNPQSLMQLSEIMTTVQVH